MPNYNPPQSPPLILHPTSSMEELRCKSADADKRKKIRSVCTTNARNGNPERRFHAYKKIYHKGVNANKNISEGSTKGKG